MVQAIIPVAGLGTGMGPHTFTPPNFIIHVAGKPILAHILDELRSVGIHRIVLVVGYLGDQVRAWVQERYPDLEATFVDQGDPLGNGHAIYVAREYFDEGPVLILFGDTIVRAHLPDLLARPESVAGVKVVDDPHRFGVAELDAPGYVTRLAEQPGRDRVVSDPQRAAAARVLGADGAGEPPAARRVLAGGRPAVDAGRRRAGAPGSGHPPARLRAHPGAAARG